VGEVLTLEGRAVPEDLINQEGQGGLKDLAVQLRLELMVNVLVEKLRLGVETEINQLYCLLILL
jgi:hypothetical protein